MIPGDRVKGSLIVSEELAAMYIPGILTGVTATVDGRRWEITDDPDHPLVVKIERPSPGELALLLQFNGDCTGSHAFMNRLQIDGGNQSATLSVYGDMDHRQFVGHALRTYLDEMRD